MAGRQIDFEPYPDITTGGIIDFQPYQAPQQPERSWWDIGAETAISTGPSVIGSFFGPVGGAVGSAVGEMGRQMYANPDDPFNWGLIGTEAGIGAIPFGKAGKGLWEGVKFGAKTGAAQAAIGSPFRHLAESGELPSLGQAATETAFGTAFGGATGAATHFLPRPPRIQAGAGAENIDLGPPPPNLKQIGSGTTTPPPPPGGMTDMNPYVEVSINNPRKQAELEALGYIPINSDGETIRFVRKDTIQDNPPSEPTTPIQDMRTIESEITPITQLEEELGMNSVEAWRRGLIERHTDSRTGQQGFRRTKQQPEPPVMEEPPIESYDEGQISRGETPTKNPLADVPPLTNVPESIISEGEVEAKYRMSVAQAVHEGLVERTVVDGETGYIELQGDLDIGEIGGFRHIGDEPKGGAANETPNEQEIRAYLSRMLGRPATDDEVQRAIDRQARTGEFTGRVAPFPPPEILTMRGDDLGNIPRPPTQDELDISRAGREAEDLADIQNGINPNSPTGEPFLRPGEGKPVRFDPTTNEVGPRGALEGFDQPVPPQMGQQNLPLGPMTPLRPRMTDMEASIDPATGKRRPPISGGENGPEWYDHPDKIGQITDKNQAYEVGKYWHEQSMERYRAGDYADADNYASLADLADERYDHLIETGGKYRSPNEFGLDKNHIFRQDLRNLPDERLQSELDALNVQPYDDPEVIRRIKAVEDEMDRRQNIADENKPGDARRFWQLREKVESDAKMTDAEVKDYNKLIRYQTIKGFLPEHFLPITNKEEAIRSIKSGHKAKVSPNVMDAILAKAAPYIDDADVTKLINDLSPKSRGSEPPTPDELAESRRGRKLEDLADELYEALDSKGATPSPSIVLNILRHINDAKNPGEALRNLTDIGAFADSATTPLQREIFEDLHRRAHAKYYEVIANTRSPELQRMIDEASTGANKEFQSEFDRSFRAWEQKQNEPYARGQLDLPLGKYEPGMPRGYEPSMQRPRNELGQFITAAEAAKTQQDIPGLVSRTGIKAKPETIVTPSIKGGVDAPRPGDPPVQPPGNVPPDQVPPGSRPPVIPPDDLHHLIMLIWILRNHGQISQLGNRHMIQ